MYGEERSKKVHKGKILCGMRRCKREEGKKMLLRRVTAGGECLWVKPAGRNFFGGKILTTGGGVEPVGNTAEPLKVVSKNNKRKGHVP